MKAAPLSPAGDHAAHQLRNPLSIDAERLGSAAHFHARTLQVEVGIYPDGKARNFSKSLSNRNCARSFAFGLKIQRCPCDNRRFQFRVALAGPSKADPHWINPGLLDQRELSARGYIKSIDQSRHRGQQRAIGIGLHGIVQRQLRRHGSAKAGDSGLHPVERIDEQRSGPGLRHQGTRGLPGDHQLTAFGSETRRNGAQRLHAVNS